jgi:hypothetical protein
MRFRASMCLVTLFVVCFTIAAWSTPLRALPGAGDARPTPDSQSLSGTIVAKNKDEDAVQFVVDDKTKVEGKLTVGARATVEYRSDGGKNIAVHVVVTPAT